LEVRPLVLATFATTVQASWVLFTWTGEGVKNQIFLWMS